MRICYLLFVASFMLASLGCSQSDYAYMKEGQSYATQIVRSVGWQWKAGELISEADPRMLKAFPESEIEKMMSESASALGTLQEINPLAGAISVDSAIPGKSALYMYDVKGQKGRATIRGKLQKQEQAWKILGFWVQINTGASSSTSSKH